MSKEKFVRDKPHVNIGSIALIVFGIISMFSLGMTLYVDIMKTRDSDGDTIPDLTEANEAHSLYFDVSDETLSFRTYEAGTGGHELGHNLGVSHDGFSTHVNVLLGLFDDVSTGAPILDFNIKYDSLIEFVDGDRNGFFDPAFDTIIGKTILDNMLRVSFGLGVDGEPAYYSSYSMIDGVFNVDFYTAREHVLLSRGIGLLSPYELKSVITITEFTPTPPGGTNLALNLSLSSSHDITFSGTASSATASTGNFEVKYEWYNLAIINDVEKTVNTTAPLSLTPSNIGSIYINFGEVINGTYDPKLYWQIPSSPSSFSITDIPWSYISIGSVTIIAIGTAAKIPRGKKKKAEPKPPPSKFDSIATEMGTATGVPSKMLDQVKDSQIPPEEESTDHVPRKKPGRVKYTDIPSPPNEAPKTITQSKKETRKKKKKSKSSKGERYSQNILSDSDF